MFTQSLFELIIIFLASFTITVSLMPMFILYFTNKKLGQMTRGVGPSWHGVKSGTPTMGGIAFLISTIITFSVMAIYKGLFDFTAVALILVFISFGTIGFLDDFLKLIRQQNEGLTSKQKMLWQLFFSAIFVVVFFLSGREGTLAIPFIGTISNKVFYAIFALIWLSGFSNAVNLTDGLDGLVAGTASIAFFAYSVMAYVQQQWIVLYFCVAAIGGLLGFFLFNKKPAKIFMGDVGSLALGGVFAVISMLLQVEWSLLLIGFVFVMETASVILQVASFKLTGKRIFKMSPIHHHFEMIGWSEWRVVTTFWMIGAIAAILYLVLFR